MAQPVDICNWALMRLGQPRINSLVPPFLDPYGVSADCAFLYPLVRDAELRSNQWSFARARAVLAADVAVPVFGTDDDDRTDIGPDWGDYTPVITSPQLNQFSLPPDFIRLIKTKYEQRRIEGSKLLTYEDAPLNLNYICRADPSLFDPLFVRALSCSLALALTEKITTSTAKKQEIGNDYKEVIADAKKVNSIEAPPERTPEDSFVLVRR